MTKWRISTGSRLQGRVRAPGSKSQSLRALLFASVATSPSTLEGVLDSFDSLAMQRACSRIGAQLTLLAETALGKTIQVLPGQVVAGDSFKEGSVQLFDAGNSGIVWRFCTALASLSRGVTLVTGDRSVLFRRPMEALVDALKQVGVEIWRTYPSLRKREGSCRASLCEGTLNGGPIALKGPWKYPNQGKIQMNGFDSQPVSAMLIAAALQEDPRSIEIHVEEPKEIPWAWLTVRWLREFGVHVDAYELSHQMAGTFYRLTPSRWPGRDYQVPSDYSSASFLIASALVTGSSIELEGLMREDPQPDRVLIDWLIEAGAALSWQEGKLLVEGCVPYRGMDVDLTGPIDLLPIATVLACYASSPSRLRGIAGAKIKESDRVKAILQELKKMGASIQEVGDALLVEPTRLHGADLDSHRDHRLAMALGVASLGSRSTSLVNQVEWVDKTYPSFAHELIRLGARFTIEP